MWGGTWARDRRGADMIRGDLEAAGIPYAVEGPDGPEYADFHALRHSYLTLGGRSGIDLRTLQELAGHSKLELTARYTHRRLHDLAGAVDKLPNLVPENPTAGKESAKESLRATGTDDVTAGPGFGCTLVARDRVGSRRSLAVIGGIEASEVGKAQMTEPPDFQGFAWNAQWILKGDRRDLNPRHPDPQSGTQHHETQEITGNSHAPELWLLVGCSDDAQSCKIIDVSSDLAYLMSEWDSLIEPVKKAILTLVRSSAA